jgi:hypothetical protein
MNKKYLITIGIALVIIAGIGLSFTRPADANPVSSTCGESSSATSSPNYMTPGTGTTTITCLVQPPNASGAVEAFVAINRTASSTASDIKIDIEYSMDGVNWYSNNTSDLGTTTPQIALAPTQSFILRFASSTLPGGGQIPVPNNREARIFKIATPTKYVRAVISVPIGSLNSGVYASIITRKDI